MENTDILMRTLRRRWALIVAGIVLAVLAGYAVASARPVEYESVSRLLVGPDQASLETLRASGLLVQTYAELVTSDSFLGGAAAEAGVPGDVGSLRDSVSAVANDTTRVLTIRARSVDQEVATALVRQLTERIIVHAPREEAVPPLDPDALGAIAPEIPDLPPDVAVAMQVEPEPIAGVVRLVDPALDPARPLDRPVMLLTLLAALVGAVVAAAAALVLETAPWRSRSADIQSLAQRRFLGRLLVVDPHRGLRMGTRKDDEVSKRSHQLVATKLQHLTADSGLGSLAVFGGGGLDSSDIVASNLASTFARGGRTVALADLTRGGELAGDLSYDQPPDVVMSVGSWVFEFEDIETGDGVVRRLRSQTVRGTDAPEPRHLVELLSEVADMVILVAQPVMLEQGTMLVAERTDGVLLVAEETAESVDHAVEAFDLLSTRGVTVLGTVVVSRTAGDTAQPGRAWRGGVEPADEARPASDQRSRAGRRDLG
jgi:hypothetical protein